MDFLNKFTFCVSCPDFLLNMGAPELVKAIKCFIFKTFVYINFKFKALPKTEYTRIQYIRVQKKNKVTS